MQAGYATAIGNGRSTQQDRAGIFELGAGGVLACVADGMSGCANGGASADEVVDQLLSLAGRAFDSAEQARQRVLRELDTVQAMLLMCPEPGTTLTVLVGIGSRLTWIHLGDSRLYRWRKGKLEQLTHDQTLRWHLSRMGRLGEVASYPEEVLRTLAGFVGADPSTHRFEPECDECDAQAGDRYMLATDGAYDLLSDSQVGHVLSTTSDPSRAAQELVDMAVRNGTNDNATVVVVNV